MVESRVSRGNQARGVTAVCLLSDVGRRLEPAFSHNHVPRRRLVSQKGKIGAHRYQEGWANVLEGDLCCRSECQVKGSKKFVSAWRCAVHAFCTDLFPGCTWAALSAHVCMYMREVG